MRQPEGPPSVARWLVRRVVGPDDDDVATTTLDELYEGRARVDGARRARRWYWRQTIGFLLRAVRIRTLDRTEVSLRNRIEEVIRDVRGAVRGLRRRPTFALVAVFTLALGIAANSAVVTLLDAHRLSRLPFADPAGVALLWETEGTEREVTTVSPGNYWAWKDRARSFSDMAAFNVDRATVSGEGAAERVQASLVTPNFFSVLGVAPVLGSTFNPRSVSEGGTDVVILSHGLWTRRFGQDTGVLGADVRLDGRPHRVVGVMPPGFRQPERSLAWQRPELWRPLDLDGVRARFDGRYLRTVARLAPGTTLEQARREMTELGQLLAAEQPEFNTDHGVLVHALDDYLMGDARPTLALLSAAGLALLLIVCANVVNLTLARTQERRREFAVRAALGSGSGRLLRQVMIEAGVLSLFAAGVGVSLVYAGRGALQGVQGRFFSELVDVSLSASVAGSIAGLTLLTGLLLGTPVAAAIMRMDLAHALAHGGRRAGSGPSAQRLRGILVVGQVALATALLTVAVLLSRSFLEIVAVAPGFDPENRLTFELTAPSTRYPESSDLEQFYGAVRREIESLPGVVSVAFASDLPFTTENRWTRIGLAGQSQDERTNQRVDYHTVSPEYFAVMGIPLLEGGLFDAGWEETGQGSVPVVVNRHLARLVAPNGDAIGTTLEQPTAEGVATLRVVGVSGDVLDDGYTAATEPIFYRPIGSSPQRRMSVVAEVRASPGAISNDVRAAVARVDPDVPAAGLRTLESMLAESVARPRAASLIGAVFAVLALLVAAAGIYGVLSYLIEMRTRELGIRAALGASARELVAMVVNQSGRMLLMGLALGWMAALLLGRTLSGLLFGVPAWDPVSLLGASVLLGGVGALASWIPARRAASVDPAEALRGD